MPEYDSRQPEGQRYPPQHGSNCAFVSLPRNHAIASNSFGKPFHWGPIEHNACQRQASQTRALGPRNTGRTNLVAKLDTP